MSNVGDLLTGRYSRLFGARRSAAGPSAGTKRAAACGKDSKVVAKMTGMTPVALTCVRLLSVSNLQVVAMIASLVSSLILRQD